MPTALAHHRRRSLLAASLLLGTLGVGATGATSTPAANPDARYAGRAVAVGQDMVAVLRDDPRAGGPEAWIRAVSPRWRPGDAYMYRVLASLDRVHATAKERGLTLTLTGTDGSAPALRVTGARSGARTFPLPETGTPDARGCTITEEHDIGAGTVAVLSNGPDGPVAFFKNAGDGTRVGGTLDRAHPALPESAGFEARIIDPDGTSPKLRTTTEGGGHPADTTAFPAPGCVK
ncbi:hypothetical protein [Streptomyces sp. NPDC086787]|uniref:hypothetical protein n=1 Tax=Streptomyces sp. NPDC086787 TaxID=3365759 RepID=UPI00381EFDF2